MADSITKQEANQDAAPQGPSRVKRGNPMKVLLRTLNTGRSQAAWDDEPDSGYKRLLLDLNVKVDPASLYRLEIIAAHNGMTRGEFARWLMEAAIEWFSDPRRCDYLDDMEEGNFVYLQEQIDYHRTRLEMMRVDWQQDRQRDIPDPASIREGDEIRPPYLPLED